MEANVNSNLNHFIQTDINRLYIDSSGNIAKRNKLEGLIVQISRKVFFHDINYIDHKKNVFEKVITELKDSPTLSKSENAALLKKFRKISSRSFDIKSTVQHDKKLQNILSPDIDKYRLRKQQDRLQASTVLDILSKYIENASNNVDTTDLEIYLMEQDFSQLTDTEEGKLSEHKDNLGVYNEKKSQIIHNKIIKNLENLPHNPPEKAISPESWSTIRSTVIRFVKDDQQRRFAQKVAKADLALSLGVKGKAAGGVHGTIISEWFDGKKLIVLKDMHKEEVGIQRGAFETVRKNLSILFKSQSYFRSRAVDSEPQGEIATKVIVDKLFPEMNPHVEMVHVKGRKAMAMEFLNGYDLAENQISEIDSKNDGFVEDKKMEHEFQKLVLLDFITGNTDRKADNWMVDTLNKRVKLIDNANCLPTKPFTESDPYWAQRNVYQWKNLDIAKRPFDSIMKNELITQLVLKSTSLKSIVAEKLDQEPTIDSVRSFLKKNPEAIIDFSKEIALTFSADVDVELKNEKISTLFDKNPSAITLMEQRIAIALHVAIDSPGLNTPYEMSQLLTKSAVNDFFSSVEVKNQQP